MPVEFVGREVQVTLSEGEVRVPLRFKLGAKEHRVAEVLATWQDHGYSGLPAPRRGPGRAGWQGGSQRQFYRLRTAEGETFEIYVDTPTARKAKPHWYAHRRLTAAATEPAAEPAAPPEGGESPAGPS